MADRIYIEGESKDFRSKIFLKSERDRARRNSFNPFFLSGMVFFSILIAFVVMLMIVILVFLKQGFSGIHALLR